MVEGEAEWQQAKEKAHRENSWFEPVFIDSAVNNIVENYLQPEILEEFASNYPPTAGGKNVGIVMAGNIPLVGFHDFLCTFLSGHQASIKLSSKDNVLLRHLVQVLQGWDSGLSSAIVFADQLKGCDAYIATGSNNSGRYFEHYFSNYPSIIRKNRTSMAILNGEETNEELEQLADDCLLYFGLGCRNVTHLVVPEHYDFQPLVNAFGKYEWMKDHAKFRNNYDYQLALSILNAEQYKTNEVVIFRESDAIYSPISVIHYQFRNPADPEGLKREYADSLQHISGKGAGPFGINQRPAITDFADGVDTMAFLSAL